MKDCSGLGYVLQWVGGILVSRKCTLDRLDVPDDSHLSYHVGKSASIELSSLQWPVCIL